MAIYYLAGFHQHIFIFDSRRPQTARMKLNTTDIASEKISQGCEAVMWIRFSLYNMVVHSTRSYIGLTKDILYLTSASRVLCSAWTWQNFQARALSDFHDWVSCAAQTFGQKISSEAMLVYMGENRLSLWSYHIGGAFSYHLTTTEFPITT